MHSIAPDTVIDGRYRAVKRLGSGGMAQVWCAEDEVLGRKVALKLMDDRFAEDPEFRERFRREAQAAAGLAHPNIVAIYDRSEWDGVPYIAMELVDGRTLKELVTERGPLPPGFIRIRLSPSKRRTATQCPVPCDQLWPPSASG